MWFRLTLSRAAARAGHFATPQRRQELWEPVLLGNPHEVADMSPANAHELISSWFVSQSASDVELRESFPSAHRPNDDYSVVYEAIFEPSSLDKARVEIWITKEGRVAFGFETRQRIAGRFALVNWRKGFAAGHEPRALSPNDVIALLRAASDGKLLLNIRTLFGVLNGIRALMSEEDRRALQDVGRDNFGWVGITKNDSNGRNLESRDTLVRFQSWRHSGDSASN